METHMSSVLRKLQALLAARA
ncbi:hypothetical protein [Nocardioides convexus]